jgi:hypothetical protein
MCFHCEDKQFRYLNTTQMGSEKIDALEYVSDNQIEHYEL